MRLFGFIALITCALPVFSSHESHEDESAWHPPAAWYGISYAQGSDNYQGQRKLNTDQFEFDISRHRSDLWRYRLRAEAVQTDAAVEKFHSYAGDGFLEVGADLIPERGLTGHLMIGVSYRDMTLPTPVISELIETPGEFGRPSSFVSVERQPDYDGFGGSFGVGVEYSPTCYTWLQARYVFSEYEDLSVDRFSASLAIPFISRRDVGYALVFSGMSEGYDFSTRDVNLKSRRIRWGIGLRVFQSTR